MSYMNHTEKREITLKLAIGQEHELLCAQKIDDPDALMYPVYLQAVRALKGIIDSSERWRKTHTHSSSDRNELYGYANNTIAFCGSRGQGKTSAMLSFCNALDCKTRAGSISRELDADGVIANNQFYAMDPIDPTMLKKGGHITEIVLSYLYRQMKYEFSQGMGVKLSIQKKEEILRTFQQSFTWLHPLGSPDQYDDFCAYEKLGHGFDIKENLYRLIEAFLELKANVYETSSSAPNINRFLVIPLDDMDLQLQNSYEVLEEVRQYLPLPNTVVLMAADIDQLRKMTDLYYRRELQSALSNDLMDADSFRRLAAKYLDKLIPASEMIYLPEYQLSFRNGDKIMVEISGEAEQETTAPRELHEALFDLVYRKTGLIFLKHASYLNNLIPTTLRGLRQFYRLLNSLPDPPSLFVLPENHFSDVNSADNALSDRKTTEATEIMRSYLEQRLLYVRQLRQNLSVFRSYFLGDWCASKLDSKSETVLRTIQHSAIPVSYATALDALRSWHKDCYPGSNNSVFSSLTETNSYSALCFILNELAKIGSDKAYMLVFAVHTLFSMQFTEISLLEQQQQIETALESEEKSGSGQFFRFHVDYSNLASRFGNCLLNRDTLLALTKHTHLGQMPETLNAYVGLLSFSSKTNTLSPNQEWQYWSAQDWAVLVCCNWEIQDCMIKSMQQASIKDFASTIPYINTLNSQLLKKPPLCNWRSNAQKAVVENSFAFFSQKTPPTFNPKAATSPMDKKRSENIQFALNLSDSDTPLKSLITGPDGTARFVGDQPLHINNDITKPTTYRLSPGSTRLPDFIDNDLSKRPIDIVKQDPAIQSSKTREQRKLTDKTSTEKPKKLEKE